MGLDKSWWKVVLGVLMTVVIIAAFLYAPRAKDLGESTRILFFHVPCAWVATLAFFISAIFSIRYLRKESARDDIWSYSAAHIGLIFTILATVSGAIWAKEIWHSYWNWDPRQTSIFILLLIYAAYFALRSAVEEEDKQARLGAVYSIIAAVTVPFFMFIIPRIYESLHPDPLINTEGQINMDTKMRNVFFASMIGFTLLFYWILRLKVEILSLTRFVQLQEANDR
ncbi:cytochrome C biogenesis protein [Candidatus Saccharibacteria bacterium]|nr:cytochrome C biogenesis protein [Calditrichia bacterium]NIV72335.1 cytochrome C biogenesis protein [Calditrichia bacterium]NIV99352.1 cytochrome C biogenesis protein [Candidatus Saccharibacteria bacterium]NIW79645.1 cytochrome C biogenesis protein [Calditrichia bacterium]